MTMRRVAGIGEMEGKGKRKTGKGDRVGVRVREEGKVKANRKKMWNRLPELLGIDVPGWVPSTEPSAA